MSTISINTPDGKTLELNAPDGATPEQIHTAATQAAQHYSQSSSSNIKSTISTIARPLLEGGGATVGGVLGFGAGGPIPAAGGGILGYGIGNQAANLLDQKMGLQQPPQNLPEALKATGQSLYEGAKNEATGMAIAPALNLLGKVAKPIASTMSGIPEKDYGVLAENPKALLPSSMEKATENLKPAREAFGVPQSGTQATEAAIDKALRDEKPFVNSLREKMKSGLPLSPTEIVDGNSAVNILLKREKDPSAKRGFMLLKDKFESLMTPEVISSNKEYSIAKSGANFRKILPLTKSGDSAVVRTLYMLSKLAGPQALISMPIMNGLPTIAGSALAKAASNPAIRRGLLPPLLQALAGLQSQIQPDESQ